MARRTPQQRRVSLALGREAEERVAQLLVDQGWSLLHRNWRGGGGELDLVVVRERRLRIVEVKARDSDDHEGGEVVGHRKRRRLMRAAEAWLAQHPHGWDEVAFMLAVVEPAGEEWRVDLMDDPFDG